MSWAMCKADFKKHHTNDQTVFFSPTEKGVCVLCGAAGYFVKRWPDLGRLVEKTHRRRVEQARVARLIAAGGSEPDAADIPRRKSGS